MSRRWAPMLWAVALAGLLLAGSSSLATAQVDPAGADRARPDDVALAPGAAGGEAAVDQAAAREAAVDDVPGAINGTAGPLLFWLFAAMTVGGALFVITRRNLVAAVMGLVGTFFAIAAVYVMLFAHFLAVIQVLVYAGAVMVLFVFVVMILNREEDEPWAVEGVLGKALALASLAYLLARLGQVLWRVGHSAPKEMHAVGNGHDWGSTRALGHVLFRDDLFPFEAVSLVLLIAVVGAIAVARPSHPRQEHAGESHGDGSEGKP